MRLGGVLVRTLDLNYEVQGSNPHGGGRPRGGLPMWQFLKKIIKKKLSLYSVQNFKKINKKINIFLLKINIIV